MRRIFSMVCLSLAFSGPLAGCATRPANVLAPIAAPPPADAGRVELLVATTRAPSTDPGQMFTGERRFGLSLMSMSVSIPPPEHRRPGTIQWPERLPPDPATDFAVLEARLLEPERIGEWTRRHLPPSGRVAVFIHGYNSAFEASVYRYAQVAADSGAEAATLVFSWPSRGSALDYAYDRESATFSRDALERTLRLIADQPEVRDVTVIAHSMGSWLAMEALRQMAIRDGAVHPKIRDVALAAPDLDVDVFAMQYEALGAAPPSIVAFVSRDDRALALSQRIGGGIDRLGQIDPEREPYKTGLQLANVAIVDLTGLRGEDRLNHGLFAQRPEIVKLLGGLIGSGRLEADGSGMALDERFTIFFQGAAQTVDGAANLIFGAPAAILSGGQPR